MLNRLQISFRGMDPSAAVETRIRERAARLMRFDGRMTSCHVVVQAPHRHQHQGVLYDVRIQMRLPGDELTVDHDSSRNHAHENVYIAIRDAFDAAERRLVSQTRRRERLRVHRGAEQKSDQRYDA